MKIKKEILCPHCQAEWSAIELPKEAIVISPCPHCLLPVALGKDRVVAVDLELVRLGTDTERRQYLIKLAQEIAGPLLEHVADHLNNLLQEWPYNKETNRERRSARISDEEVKKFVDEELKLIDKKEFFEKTFGQ